MSAVHAALLEVRVDGGLLPAAYIARELDVSKQLVHWWVKSGKLKPAGTAPDGRALYSLADAALVDRDTRRSPHSRRRSYAA